MSLKRFLEGVYAILIFPFGVLAGLLSSYFQKDVPLKRFRESLELIIHLRNIEQLYGVLDEVFCVEFKESPELEQVRLKVKEMLYDFKGAEISEEMVQKLESLLRKVDEIENKM